MIIKFLSRSELKIPGHSPAQYIHLRQVQQKGVILSGDTKNPVHPIIPNFLRKVMKQLAIFNELVYMQGKILVMLNLMSRAINVSGVRISCPVIKIDPALLDETMCRYV